MDAAVVRNVMSHDHDHDAVLNRLAQSSFRRRFALSPADVNELIERGRPVVHRQIIDILTERLGPASPANDGRQTPMRGHPIFIAQHATATCCRSCVAKWHDIPTGRAMSAAQVQRLALLIERWMQRRVVEAAPTMHERDALLFEIRDPASWSR